MTEYYLEIRPDIQRLGPLKLVPAEEISQYRGFRSMYLYYGDILEIMQQTRSTRDLRGLPVRSEELFVDFDDEPEAAADFGKHLQQREVGYTTYNSGNRSVHFHVPLEPMVGPTVPLLQKDWVKRHAPGADLSIYKTTGIWRLEGTYHKKNPGHKKHQLLKTEGKLLLIKEKQLDYSRCTRTVELPATEVSYRKQVLTSMLLKNVHTGFRRPHMFNMIALGVETQMPLEELTSLILYWNDNTLDTPHSSRAVEQYTEQTYNQLLRSYA